MRDDPENAWPARLQRMTDEAENERRARGEAWRESQAARLLRYVRSLGFDPEQPTSGPRDFDLTPILDAHGSIVPEPEDIQPLPPIGIRVVRPTREREPEDAQPITYRVVREKG